MQEIRLTKMRIRNFKGIRELDIDFATKDMNIFGDNGTGKTSIIDSFTWLLFGKDSLNRADFGIKPTDSAGNITHQLETSVEAVLDVSGVEKSFKKTLVEIWTRKRGAAEAEFTRNENNFYIDGVPKKKAEYTAAIKELIDEEVFRIITNPLYFNESVNWKDRRSVLLAICGGVSDEEIIASKEELHPLSSLLNGKSVADFKEITASAMKRINQELEMIPVKIDEAERAKPRAESMEVDFARKEALTQEIEVLRVQKSNIVNGAEASQARQKIAMLRQESASLEARVVTAGMAEKESVAQLKAKLQSDEVSVKNAESQRDILNRRLTANKSIRSGYSKEWDEVFAERFTDSVCPTCGRELPAEEVEEKTKAFNVKKASRLDDIERKNREIGIEITRQEIEAKELSDIIFNFSVSIEKTMSDIGAAQEALLAKQETVRKEVELERERIAAEIAGLEATIHQYEENTEEAVAVIDAKIAALTGALSTIDEAIASKALLERQDKRIAELREQQKRLASEYTVAEKSLYLAEQFIVAKVNMLNERINQRFKYAKLKLFDKQINGGINEVCEVTYNGIPYKDLNNAMRINIGLDVINTISDYYGVTAPILIDNAESVNELFHTTAQQVRFYVSKDRAMRMEAV